MTPIRRLKVMTVIGTRPEIIRLSCVMAALDKYCDQIIVHTGQNYDYELNEIFFRDLGVREPNHFLNCAGGGSTAAETIGKVFSAVDDLLEKEKPDAFLVLGDTNSCLSVIAAKRRKIPVFHMEAGNRCFDQRVPEEINRRIIDHVSDINMVYSDIAREYLYLEGLPPAQIMKTGSPMYEVLTQHKHEIDASKVHEELSLTPGNYFVVSAHREENIEPEDAFRRLVAIINAVADRYDMPVIVSTHPRTQARLGTLRDITFKDQVRIMKPLGFLDYVALQKRAKAVLSDSGTINEESSILNFPALNIREAHERPESTDEASTILTGLSIERVMQGLDVLDHQPRGEERLLRPVEEYMIPNVSEKVVRIIIGYTDYVNRTVWKKYAVPADTV